jgi:hypothetical protein
MEVVVVKRVETTINIGLTVRELMEIVQKHSGIPVPNLYLKEYSYLSGLDSITNPDRKIILVYKTEDKIVT